MFFSIQYFIYYRPSIHLSVNLSIHLSIHLAVHLLTLYFLQVVLGVNARSAIADFKSGINSSPPLDKCLRAYLDKLKIIYNTILITLTDLTASILLSCLISSMKSCNLTWYSSVLFRRLNFDRLSWHQAKHGLVLCWRRPSSTRWHTWNTSTSTRSYPKRETSLVNDHSINTLAFTDLNITGLCQL